MTVSQTDPHTAASGARRWLSIAHSAEAGMTVVVNGGAMARRAEELWSSVEYALEVTAGGLVTVDLTHVTGFDLNTVAAVHDVVRAADRRHDDVQIVVLAGSALDEYTHSCGLVRRIIRREA